ncbi:MAG: signal peptidase II [Elusimicrobia bacterium GWA2_62_23]|nr:MAG: signal peptidase II [Elusimicrobia bacterium GWA2_62_23]OGR71466.1 MAG: signal peptidase II [Elusimicrobia bacterium GWC2_63_65]
MSKLTSPAIVLAVFLLDRLTKAAAVDRLYMKSVQVLPFFRLTWAENTGVSFGLFTNNNLFFLVFSALLVCALLLFRRRLQAHGRAAAVGLALVLGGALGNLYDRIAYGFVVDFLDFSFFPAVFNAADSAITVGALLLAWGMRERSETRKT